jgi:molybdopterin converting factor small subunit
MSAPNQIIVEFFGVPRERAGRAELGVTAATVGDALRKTAIACPALTGLMQGGRLAPHYLLSVNGERFATDLDTRLNPGDRLLLLSADAGG